MKERMNAALFVAALVLFGSLTALADVPEFGTLTIDDVIVEDHPFDIENSILSASIFKRR